MTMKSADREYAARVIEGIISDKQSKGCANSCIECSQDSKGCARDPGGFDWKYKGILEKAIELLRKPEPVDDKNICPGCGIDLMYNYGMKRNYINYCPECGKELNNGA